MLNRKRQVTVNGIQTMVQEDLLIDGVDFYNSDMTEDTVRQTQAYEDKILADYNSLVSSHIQDRIDTYNKANFVDFGKIHNMAIYLQDNTYTHYQFAVDVITWNKLVWESYRTTMLDVKNGVIDLPTDIIATLPTYGGVV